MSKRLYEMTGTGWPLDQQADDMRLASRAAAYGEALGDEVYMREFWAVLGVHPGTRLPDALPLGHRARAALAVFGHTPERVFLHRVREALAERRTPAMGAQATCLYRFFDDGGRLLYVGVAYNPDAREQQHRRSQRWAPLIDEREDEWFDTRREALTAELDAIRDESPLFNEAGRPRLPALEPEVSA